MTLTAADRRQGSLAFVASGAAALIFEVCLQRQLTRLLGVSGWSTAIVLATYMSGLLLGSSLLAPLADRVRRPLRAYALFELAIGAWAVAVPAMVAGLTRLIVSAFADEPSESPRLLAARTAAALAVTLVPTFVMGATLPAFARGFASLGAAGVARLYQLNLFGAALGAGLGTWLLLPDLGLWKSFAAGAALNAVAALLALSVDRHAQETAAPPSAPDAPVGSVLPSTLAWVAFLSGAMTFAAQITWTHLLASVVGSSSYAFGGMLTVFLVGLMLGSLYMARAEQAPATLETLGRLQLFAASGLLLTLPLWMGASNWFVLAGPVVTSFAGREAVRAALCVELMLVPAALLGTIFPLVLRVASQREVSGKAIGRLAAFNTLGAVVGALSVSFLILPRTGSKPVLVGLVVLSAALGALWLRGRWRLGAVATAVLALALPGWDLRRITAGTNVYFADMGWPQQELLWAKESIVGGITTVVQRAEPRQKTMLTNGKFQGNDTGEIAAQRAFAQLPMLAGHDFTRAMLIGVGTGNSLSTLAAQPFEQVDAVELSGDILAAARAHFSQLNKNVLDSPKVRVHETDGRNFLLMSTAKYDTVSIEVSSIWFAGAADLYNREFCRLVAEHLAPRGVLQQWVQLHHLSRRDLALILNSMRSELPHVSLFLLGRQGIALASKEPLTLDYPRLTALSAQLWRTPATKGLPAGDVLTLAGTLLLDEAGVDALVREEAGKQHLAPEALVSGDDNLWLEYSTPRANADPSLGTEEALVDSLAHLSRGPLPVTGVNTPEEKVHLEAALEVAGDVPGARRLLAEGPVNEAGRKLAEAMEEVSPPK